MPSSKPREITASEQGDNETDQDAGPALARGAVAGSTWGARRAPVRPDTVLIQGLSGAVRPWGLWSSGPRSSPGGPASHCRSSQGGRHGSVRSQGALLWGFRFILKLCGSQSQHSPDSTEFPPGTGWEKERFQKVCSALNLTHELAAGQAPRDICP